MLYFSSLYIVQSVSELGSIIRSMVGQPELVSYRMQLRGGKLIKHSGLSVTIGIFAWVENILDGWLVFLWGSSVTK